MLIAVVVLSVALLAVTAYHMLYRRQVERLGRQLAFINENRTAMLPSTDLTKKELVLIAEEMAKLKKKLDNAERHFKTEDESLRETIANISHDIRTPLTSLDGYFQLLSEQELTQEKRRQYVRIIKERIAGLNDMLDELFTYAKLQDRNYEIELSEVNISALTEDILMSFYEELSQTGSTPEINLPGEDINVSGNREAIRRIEQNIIKNAIMHGKRLQLAIVREKHEAVFICSDELPADIMNVDTSRVFDRFYKADASRNTKGSGLGLAISKELTERMGGHILAECNNRIFTIKVYLPEIK